MTVCTISALTKEMPRVLFDSLYLIHRHRCMKPHRLPLHSHPQPAVPYRRPCCPSTMVLSLSDLRGDQQGQGMAVYLQPVNGCRRKLVLVMRHLCLTTLTTPTATPNDPLCAHPKWLLFATSRLRPTEAAAAAPHIVLDHRYILYHILPAIGSSARIQTQPLSNLAQILQHCPLLYLLLYPQAARASMKARWPHPGL